MSDSNARGGKKISEPIRVVIADDHEIVRRGLCLTIQEEPDLELVGEAINGEEAIRFVRQAVPDVLLLDLQMPGINGVQVAKSLRAEFPDVAILILTSFRDDAYLYAALRAGVDGYLLKDISGEELVQSIRKVVRGKPQLHPDIARRLMERAPLPQDPFEELTERERDVLKLIASGKSNKEIASILILTEATVKGYVSSIFDKLNVFDRTQAALLAVRYGLVPPDDMPA